MTALTPVPATYAPNSVRHRTRRPRYAAATMLRHAREAMSSLHRWQPTASPSHCHRTAARWWTKTPIACPVVWSTLYVLSLDRARTVRVGRHEGIAVVGRRDERLLDRARADPANQVPHRARLVVRPRCARAAERLLPDDRPGRLVVHVEVAGGVLRLRIDEGGHDRAEELLLHRAKVWIVGFDHRRLDEEAFAVVVASADEDVRLLRRLRFLDRVLLRL